MAEAGDQTQDQLCTDSPQPEPSGGRGTGSPRTSATARVGPEQDALVTVKIFPTAAEARRVSSESTNHS